MKNKSKKLKSLKSILILLQQLQVRYYGKCGIDIMTFPSGTIMIYIQSDDDPKSVNFFDYEGTDRTTWEAKYEEIVTYLNNLEL